MECPEAGLVDVRAGVRRAGAVVFTLVPEDASDRVAHTCPGCPIKEATVRCVQVLRIRVVALEEQDFLSADRSVQNRNGDGRAG